MELLPSRIGSPIDSYVSTTDDEAQPRGTRHDEGPSPLILWCARLSSGAIAYLVDAHPRKLLTVGNLFNQDEVFGNVAIAAALIELGILRDAARDARHALPHEISDEFSTSPRQELSPPHDSKEPCTGVQTSLFNRRAS